MAFHYRSCANDFPRSLELCDVTWLVSGCDIGIKNVAKLFNDAYFFLFFRPETAGRWLTKDEKAVAVMRTQSSGNTDDKPFDKHQFISALIDYKNWLAGSVYEGSSLIQGEDVDITMILVHVHSDDLCWIECRSRQLCCLCPNHYSWSRFQCTECSIAQHSTVCRCVRASIRKYIIYNCSRVMANDYWKSLYLGIRIAPYSVGIILWPYRAWQSLDTFSFWQLLMLECVTLALFWWHVVYTPSFLW